MGNPAHKPVRTRSGSTRTAGVEGMTQSAVNRLLGTGRSSSDVACAAAPTHTAADIAVTRQMAGARFMIIRTADLRTGLDVREQDDQSRPPVVIVNETMARLHWPGNNPVGKRVK